jgi:hypothetical protein
MIAGLNKSAFSFLVQHLRQLQTMTAIFISKTQQVMHNKSHKGGKKIHTVYLYSILNIHEDQHLFLEK